MAEGSTSITPRTSRNPFAGLMDIRREMDRFFEDLPWPSFGRGEGLTTTFAPLGEVKESDNEYIFRFEVPGLDKEDINVELSENALIISGEKKIEKEEQSEKQHFSEISYGSFYRRFVLPTKVDEQNVNAEYKNGVLNIKVKKAEASKAKKVQIQ